MESLTVRLKGSPEALEALRNRLVADWMEGTSPFGEDVRVSYVKENQ